MVLVRFPPQAWVNDQATAVDPEGETLWDVGDVAPGLKSNSDETDGFRDHPNAPAWVKEWRGPYYIEMLYDTAVD